MAFITSDDLSNSALLGCMLDIRTQVLYLNITISMREK